MSNKDEALPVEKQGTGGFLSSAVNLLKSIIGSGILALPAAFASVGAVPGLLLLAVAAFVSAFGLQLLIKATDRVTSKGLVAPRTANFSALAGPTYPKLWVLFEAVVMVKCSLVATSYLTIAGSVMTDIFKTLTPSAWPIMFSQVFWVSAIAGLIAPVVFMHRMDSLKYTSFLGLLGIAYLFVLSVVLFFVHNDSVGESFSNINMFVPFKFSSVSSFSVFVFALTCHQNVNLCLLPDL
ncbi:hypothetical protein PSACC_00160 [Paramicrosporidium saccamoebae]|uniref:Amino acid transporter transmembrane domain-containing protein n=1 Tax=Paramicrosporidium saccamoebae TaxID=1246581 RepID=A0A2H9TQJ2_9FUNG|nr:hypothetical protein PSACC_00160 [Paramicrosporidium saccamoebae]